MQAVAELVAIGAPAVEALIASLNNAAPEVRWRALVALGWIGDTRAVEPLLNALRDSAWEVRHNAAWALGQIADPQAADDLVTTMRDDDEQVCVMAAYALARMQESQRLQLGLNDADERTWRAARAALSLLANDTGLVSQHQGQQAPVSRIQANHIVREA
jgi:HEAT repeat protein